MRRWTWIDAGIWMCSVGAAGAFGAFLAYCVLMVLAS